MEDQSEEVSSDEDLHGRIRSRTDSQQDEYIELMEGSLVKLWKSGRFRLVLVEVTW